MSSTTQDRYVTGPKAYKVVPCILNILEPMKGVITIMRSVVIQQKNIKCRRFHPRNPPKNDQGRQRVIKEEMRMNIDVARTKRARKKKDIKS